MAALLGLFWRLLREGKLKVARGRSWQPEIGMEHASRGRRSGNNGVGARSRGRFRIFSARHCSRTKVSHAENSGMTMLFFSWKLLRCRRGILSHPRERPATHAAAGAAARGVRGDWGIVSHPWERQDEGFRNPPPPPFAPNPCRPAPTGLPESPRLCPIPAPVFWRAPRRARFPAPE